MDHDHGYLSWGNNDYLAFYAAACLRYWKFCIDRARSGIGVDLLWWSYAVSWSYNVLKKPKNYSDWGRIQNFWHELLILSRPVMTFLQPGNMHTDLIGHSETLGEARTISTSSSFETFVRDPFRMSAGIVGDCRRTPLCVREICPGTRGWTGWRWYESQASKELNDIPSLLRNRPDLALRLCLVLGWISCLPAALLRRSRPEGF